jgi:hypothetical protein
MISENKSKKSVVSIFKKSWESEISGIRSIEEAEEIKKLKGKIYLVQWNKNCKQEDYKKHPFEMDYPNIVILME